MLAQEGSQSRRSSSTTVEAVGNRRRKSRAVSSVSDTGRSRVAVTSQKLPRKYSLNDGTSGVRKYDATSCDTSGVFLVERERERLEVEDGCRGSREVFAEGCLLEFDRGSSRSGRDLLQRSGEDTQRSERNAQRNWSWRDSQRNSSEKERDSQRSGKDSQRNWSEKDSERNWSGDSQRSEGDSQRNWSEEDAHRNLCERDSERNQSERDSQRNTNERVGVHLKVTGSLENGNQVTDRNQLRGSSTTGVTGNVEGISQVARFGGSRSGGNDFVDCASKSHLNWDEESRLHHHQVSNVENVETNSYPDRRNGESRFNVNKVLESGSNCHLTKDEDRRFSVNDVIDYKTNSHPAGEASSRRNSQVQSRNQVRRNAGETWRDVESTFDSLLTDGGDNDFNSQVARLSDNRINNVNNVREPLTSSRFAESRPNPQVANNVENDENPELRRVGETSVGSQIVGQHSSVENPDFSTVGDSRHSSQIVGQSSLVDERNHQVLENRVATSSDNSERSSTQVNDENITPRHRPKSWYAKTTTAEDEQAKARRRKTHPGHHADYQEALSSLLWQPYECQRDLATVCSSPDDSDVAYWLGCRMPEFRIPREEQDLSSRYRDDGGSLTRIPGFGEQDLTTRYRDDGGSLSSSRTTSSLSVDSSVGGEVSDREEWLERLPPRAPASPHLPVATGCLAGAVVSQAPDAGKNVSAMRSPVIDSGPLPAVSSSVVSNNNSTSSINNNNNVSLVRCYAATSGVSSVPSIDCVVASSSSTNSTNPVVRTFTSTEAQTDDVIVDTAAVVRPRERRRHHNRRQQPPIPPPPTTTPLTDRLPDILNSHLPPPYTTLPHLGLPPPVVPVPSIPVLTAVPPPGSPPPHPHPHTPAAVSNLVAGLRFPFAIVPAGRRRSRQYASSEEPKSCCGVVVSQAASVRWLMLLVLLVGLCCAFVGTLLLVTRAAGRDHLTLALLIIGVGVVLVGVSAAAWRLTSQEGGAASSCRAMLGLAGPDELGASEPNRRFVPRLPPSYGRPHHPYAAMMYPEFQYRAPPPSYQASMQEYRLRLLLLDRHTTPVTNSMSPPPTYRSQAGSLLRAPIVTNRRDLIHYQVAASQQSDYSRPPSYRSRTSCSRSGVGPGGDPATHSISSHSRDPSQLSMTSDAGAVTMPPSTVNVITVMGGHHHEEAEPIIKLAPGDETSLSPIAPKDDTKDSNLVTIVQTSSQSTGPVIVTISGNADADGQCSRDTEMEILAHL